MTRAIGIGGIFFKTTDPSVSKAWYANHVEFNIDEWETDFTTTKIENPSKNAFLQWSQFQSNTDYFESPKKNFMINRRVDDLRVLVNVLQEEGVPFVIKSRQMITVNLSKLWMQMAIKNNYGNL